MQGRVDLGSWLIILLTISFLSGRHRHEQTFELAARNQELVHEVSQRKRAEERTRYLACYDELTTLPNRQLFKERLALAMEQADRDERISVDVSGTQLRAQRLAGAVLAALESSRMDPQHLELEITKSAMMLDAEEAASCLHLLSAQGIRIAFGDFLERSLMAPKPAMPS